MRLVGWVLACWVHQDWLYLSQTKMQRAPNGLQGCADPPTRRARRCAHLVCDIVA